MLREGVLSSVDVVVPCYNYARFLERCVDSLLTQVGIHLRVLIIDDASSDDTPHVGERLALRDPRVTFRRHEVNRGHIATYNEGLIEWAAAQYSLLISADDALAPGALTRAVRIMDRHNEVEMVYGMALIIIGDESPIKAPELFSDDYRIVPGFRFLQFCCENCYNPVPTPTAIVRTEAQHLIGGYRAEFPHTGDLEMWMRFAVRGPIGVLRGVQGYYRWHAGNMGHSYYTQIVGDRRDVAHTCEYVLAPLRERLPESRQWLRAAFGRLAERAFLSAMNAFDRGDTAECETWIEFAEEISSDLGHPPMPSGLQVRRLMGQTLWQLVRPTWNRFRGRPIEPNQREQFRPQSGDQIGWWPEYYATPSK